MLAPLLAAAMSVPLVPLAPPALQLCRSDPLVRPACPTVVPRVGARYLRGLYRDGGGSSGVQRLAILNLERGGEDPSDPERNRPPRMGHVLVAGGDIRRAAPFAYPARGTRFADGLLRRPRSSPLYLGQRGWGGRVGRLYLAPPYDAGGGMLGNHLLFVWRERGVDRLLSLHAWEPLRETQATLRMMVASTG